MRLYPVMAASAALALVLSACTDSPEDRRTRAQVMGGVGGAAVGSLFGSGSGQAVAIGAGAVLGTIAGGKIADGEL